MAKETKRPKKTLKEQLKKSAELALTAGEQLEYENYASKRKMCEVDILDAEYDGKISQATTANKRLDKLEAEYSSNPKFAQKYEFEREKRYVKAKKEALKQLSSGNHDKYNELLSEANEEARFMSKEQLAKCDNHINNAQTAKRQKEAGKLAKNARLNEDAKFLRLYNIDVNQR